MNEEYIIIRDRESALNPVYWNSVLQTSEKVLKIYGKALSKEFNIFSNGRMNSIMIKKEWEEIGEYISENILKDKKYFSNIVIKTNLAGKKILDYINILQKTDLSKIKTKRLIKKLENIRDLFMEYDAASIYSWFISGDILKHKIEKVLCLSKEEFEVVSLPAQKTFSTQMEIDILEAIVSNEKIEKESKKLSKKYYWIPFGYDGPIIWDNIYFINKINEKPKDIARKELSVIYNHEKQVNTHKAKIEKKLTNKLKYLIRILHYITTWTDERKMLEFQLFYYYFKILKELEKRYSIPLINLKYLFYEELNKIEYNKEDLIRTSNERINHEFMLITENSIYRIGNSEELKYIKEKIKNNLEINMVKGIVVSKGKESRYIAKAKILLSPKDNYKITEEDILVASMTSPDYVPAMQKAMGFITDEGGITSHAAIVAREMKKPCIIGTRIGSKFFHDGDVIEMDMEKGIVRILERAK